MIIEWRDPNRRMHGKRHKRDRYYFRWHYGRQHCIYINKEYVDNPTAAQRSARETFTALRKEVARQLKDAVLRKQWEKRFKRDAEGYKMLHTYVYAMLKRGETVMCQSVKQDTKMPKLPVINCAGEQLQTASCLLIYHNMIMPLWRMESKVRQKEDELHAT